MKQQPRTWNHQPKTCVDMMPLEPWQPEHMPFLGIAPPNGMLTPAEVEGLRRQGAEASALIRECLKTPPQMKALSRAARAVKS